MPGRGQGAKRKRNASKTSQTISKAPRIEEERLNLLENEEGQEKNNGKVVDFEKIISESLLLPTQHSVVNNEHDLMGNADLDLEHSKRIENEQNFYFNSPEKIRCGGDQLGFHVPESIKLKIKQNDYINLAVLLKGSVELSEMNAGAMLGVDENGNIVTKPKVSTERVQSIEKWSDAFLIYSSIYLSAHPDQTQDLLHYMFVIREAAYKYGGTFWRTYDEQFRLRQAIQFTSWSSINSDLWLRCFSGATRGQGSVGNSTISQTKPTQAIPPPCIDFNKGYCKWVNCRYSHVCSTCYNSQHGRWLCKANNNNFQNAQNTRPNL